MKKVRKSLSQDQVDKGIIFTSTLSEKRTEQIDDTIHEVLSSHTNIEERIKRLENDNFFNNSPFIYNIIRT